MFSFRKATQEEVSKIIRDLNAKKSCETGYTPTKIIKLTSDIFPKFELKHADIVPIYKK